MQSIRRRAVLAGAMLLVGACSLTPPLPAPQRLVLPTGARLDADAARLKQVNEWLRAQLQRVSCRIVVPGRIGEAAPSTRVAPPRPRPRTELCLFGSTGVNGDDRLGGFRRGLQDPRIHVRVISGDPQSYPWETLIIEGDTAQVAVPRTQPDAEAAYGLYAYLHLLARQGRILEALPEAAGLEGYGLERLIVAKVADAWLLARSALAIDPFEPLDALVYANEAGWLDAFLLTARPRSFRAALDEWVAENPEGPDAFRSWFRVTLGREPPGLRSGDARR